MLSAAVKISSVTYLFSAVAILIAAFFSIMGFFEFFEIIILKKTGGYPFGCVNECIWYYKNASTYGMYNLFSGLLFGLTLAMIIIGILKRKSKLMTVAATVVYLLLILQLASGSISL